MSAYKRIENIYTPEEKQLYWRLSNGLQAVDGLKPSKYLLEQQSQEVAGNITLENVKQNIEEYYVLRESEISAETKEADIVSIRISEYLRSTNFRLHPLALKGIHKFLFEGLDDFNAGNYRTYNFSKEEAILFGRSVRYEDHSNIEEYLDYDIEKEIKASLNRSSFDMNGFIDFISGIWQIHPFCEGNTRTVAVFAIQYLNSLGFDVNNEPFAENAKYLRDALVRACYNDMANKISPDFSYIRKFFENVILGENHNLKSEDLIVMRLKR